MHAACAQLAACPEQLPGRELYLIQRIPVGLQALKKSCTYRYRGLRRQLVDCSAAQVHSPCRLVQPDSAAGRTCCAHQAHLWQQPSAAIRVLTAAEERCATHVILGPLSTRYERRAYLIGVD
jgi:hypothetical protein